ncbi:MAG: hypothetical protein O2782_10630, partial [bacterium]|nr:hypothetical protein [bacterium]
MSSRDGIAMGFYPGTFADPSTVSQAEQRTPRTPMSLAAPSKDRRRRTQAASSNCSCRSMRAGAI